MLRRDRERAALLVRLPEFDRLVLLGDTLELRHGPVRDALAAGAPVLAEIAGALGSRGEVVVVPGNHDHALLRGWIERRDPSVELGLESAVDPDPREPLGALAAALSAARVRVAYPGVWLREDVYAIHGHYGDRHNTVPILERLGAGLTVRVAGEPAGGPARAEDYEAALAPMYPTNAATPYPQPLFGTISVDPPPFESILTPRILRPARIPASTCAPSCTTVSA